MKIYHVKIPIRKLNCFINSVGFYLELTIFVLNNCTDIHITSVQVPRIIYSNANNYINSQGITSGNLDGHDRSHSLTNTLKWKGIHNLKTNSVLNKL